MLQGQEKTDYQREYMRIYRKLRRSPSKRNGYLYLIRCTLFAYYKIGVTQGSVEDRIKGLQTGCPFPLNIVKMVPCGDIDSAERYMHSIFNMWRHGGEWFLFDTSTLETVIKKMNHVALFYKIVA